MIARSRLSILLAVAAICWSLSGCARRSALELAPEGSGGPSVGVYKAHLDDPGRGESRRFRLLLFAGLPDRLHAEILSPLGQTEMILDGGDGTLAVTIVSEAVSYVGPGSAELLGRLFGVPIALDELVRGVLTGEADPDSSYSLERTAESEESLPRTLVLRTETARLSLERRRTRSLSSPSDMLGTGDPPPGTEVRDLEELDRRLGEKTSTTIADPG